MRIHVLPIRVSAKARHFKVGLERLRYRYLENFIFIHINKTGGSSIERALHIPHEHKTALERIAEIGHEQWGRKFTFAVVRNPWDKVVSHYAYRIQTNQTNLQTHPVGFNEWVGRTYGSREPTLLDNEKMFMPQMDWITDQEGRLLVDRVCKFERLEHDFEIICRDIGKRVKLPHIKASQRGNYRAYYNGTTKAIVGACFEKDVEQFGYRF